MDANKKQQNPELLVDVRIVYRGRVYSFAFGNILKWLLPLALLGAKLLSSLREAPS